MSEQKENSAKLEELLNIIEGKYKIKRELLFTKINRKEIDFTIGYYKNFDPNDLEYQVDAVCANSHRDPNIDVIVESINQYINECKEEQKENTSNKKGKNITFSNNEKELLNNNTAKIPYITTNQKITYSSSVIFNEGNNQNDKKLNPQNAEIIFKNEKLKPYSLIPEDFSSHREAFKKYFTEKREKLMEELGINPNDLLLGQNKFILFIAFDIIDTRPNTNDIIGIDPLNDYQKYKIKFEVNDSTDFFVTSGQIVYIEGNIIDKNTIDVVKISRGFKIVEFTIEQENSNYYNISNDPYAIYYLNGPFCPKEILDYGVFFEVLKELVSKNPHLLIINGPFFSCDNDVVKSCKINTEEEMLNIFKKINEMFSKTRTKIYICPGISDIENYYPLPQPPFDALNKNYENTFRNTNINFISNPQIFTFNEADIAVVNFDVLKDIISNSVYTSKIQTLDKACDMILNQKNLYPVMANTINTSYENSMEKITTIDLMKYDFLSFDTKPDIILTSSLLKNFVKKYRGTIFVNCGSFIKGKNFGELGKITIHSMKNVENIELSKKIKVEFIKIKGDLNKIIENHEIKNKDNKNKNMGKNKINNTENKKTNDEDVEMKDVSSKNKNY